MPTDLFKQIVAKRGKGRLTPETVGEFVRAGGSDIGEIWEGIKGLPGAVGGMVTSPIDTGSQIIGGLADEVSELAHDPVGKFLRQPITTVLDFAGIGGVGKGIAVKAGMATSRSGRLAKLLRVKQLSKVEEATKELIRARHGNIEVAKYQAKLLADKIKKGFKDEVVREDMTFYTQGTRNPRLDTRGAGVAPVVERLKRTKGAVEAADEMARHREALREAANASGLAGDMGWVGNYITQFWRVPKRKAQVVARRFAQKNPFDNPRRFKSFEQGMAAEFEPLTLDAAELTRMYEARLVEVIENNRLIRELHSLEVAPGEFAIMQASKAPRGYIEMAHPALRRPFAKASGIEKLADEFTVSQPHLKAATTAGGGRVPVTSRAVRQKKLVTGDTPVRVHPEIANVLKSIFEERFSGNLARRMTYANAFMKKAALSFSLFHHFALTESAWASLGFKGLGLTKRTGFRRGLELLKDQAASETALRAGLNLGPLADVQVGVVRRALGDIESGLRKTPVLGKLAKGVRKANDVWDKVLWDYYHTGLKSYAFHETYAKALRRSPGVDKARIAREVAEFTNDAFGGQAWELLFKTPRWQQMAHWTFLAPDWTISNLRIALRPFGSGVTARLGQEYWLRSALAGVSVTALLNYASSKRTDGVGRWPWENEPGHELDIQLPYRDEKGRRQYMKMGKQMREPLRWISEPTKIFGAKLSPAIQIAIEQLTGSSTTGFPQEFKDLPPGEQLVPRLAATAEKFVPFAVRGNNFGFTFPKSAGTTGYKVISGLKRALKENDEVAIRRWMQAALDNGYNAKTLLRIAKADVTRERRKSRR